MALGTIFIDTDHSTDSEVCDALLEYDVVIADIGLRPLKSQRRRTISDELRQRPEMRYRKDRDVVLLTYCINGEGRICSYDHMIDPDHWDEFDVLLPPNDLTLDDVEVAIEKLAAEWREKGKPRRYHTTFEYVVYRDEDQD